MRGWLRPSRSFGAGAGHSGAYVQARPGRDAPRLGRWLFGRDLKKTGDAPEQMVPIPTPVPLFVTYLTAEPSNGSIAYFDDVYGRDAARLATLGKVPMASR